MIDTHAHIYDEVFQDDIDLVIDKAKTTGITQILMPNIDFTSIDRMLKVESCYPHYCLPMMGLHPCSVKEDFETQLEVVEMWAKKRHFIAIGEIGLDLYWDKSFFEQQKKAFLIQCRWAVEMNLPVVIHCRESINETIKLLKSMKEPPKGVFHCFTGDAAQGEQIIDLGMFLGIGGVATFKNAGMKNVLPLMDSSFMVLETDSPYLAPVPYRGKRNEPSYIEEVAKKLAVLVSKDISEIKSITTVNAKNLFGI